MHCHEVPNGEQLSWLKVWHTHVRHADYQHGFWAIATGVVLVLRVLWYVFVVLA